MKHPVEHIVREFQIEGTCLESCPYGSGHINDTFLASFGRGGGQERHIVQRINRRIFKDPSALMDNILRVTAEARRQLALAGAGDITRRSLTVIPALDGKAYWVDGAGDYWRCYRFIEGARTYDVIQSRKHAYEAARAFGEFQRLASGIPGPRLRETIPDFHHTRARFDRLAGVAGADTLGRLRGAEAEWEFIRRRENMVDRLLLLQQSGAIPERVAHNDTKLNNVMIDEATGCGICVIDLDTVMPGLALHDFGDMVRTATSPAAEDERDLSKVRMQMPMFESLVQGYLSATGGFLTGPEIEQLAFSGRLITLEIGIRFLTDYLEGDPYFKIRHPQHNLERCRTQLALVRSMEEQEEGMEEAVRRAAGQR